MKYKVVIFDLDNTLIDFDAMEDGSLKSSLKALDIPYTPEMIDHYKAINQKLWKGVEKKEYLKEEILSLRFKLLFDAYNIEACAEKMHHLFLDNMVDHLYMIDYAFDILDALKHKVVLVCLTNGVKKAQVMKFKKSGLDAYFDHVIISDEVGFHKPDIEIFKYMEKLIGDYKASEMIIIGDSLSSDIQGGLNYGIETVWFNKKGIEYEDHREFDYEIRSLSDLKDILGC